MPPPASTAFWKAPKLHSVGLSKATADPYGRFASARFTGQDCSYVPRHAQVRQRTSHAVTGVDDRAYKERDFSRRVTAEAHRQRFGLRASDKHHRDTFRDLI
jgi:hypothetical protein